MRGISADRDEEVYYAEEPLEPKTGKPERGTEKGWRSSAANGLSKQQFAVWQSSEDSYTLVATQMIREQPGAETVFSGNTGDFIALRDALNSWYGDDDNGNV